MSEENLETKQELSSQNTAALAAMSTHREDVIEALKILYIPNNASGRNKFRDKWPEVADYLFGDELIGFDNDGTRDWERRRELENEADQRRVFLESTMEDVLELSVKSGVLEFEYVGKVLDAFGAIISKYIYADDIIERVRPGLIASAVAAASVDGAAVSDTKLSEEEKTLLSNPPSDSLDDVQPIDLSADLAASPIAQEEVADDSRALHELSHVGEDEQFVTEPSEDAEVSDEVDVALPADVEEAAAPSNPAPSADVEEAAAPSNPAPSADAEEAAAPSNPAPPIQSEEDKGAASNT